MVPMILVVPKAACTMVIPTPHIMASVVPMVKLEVLYTKAMQAELTAPKVSGIMKPIRKISKE